MSIVTHRSAIERHKTLTQTLSLMMGFLLLALGLTDILFPELSSLHFSTLHAMIIAISGMTLFYTGGQQDNERDAFLSCLCFGIFFGLHSVLGFLFGVSETPEMGDESLHPELLRIIPNFSELRKRDHVVNGLIAAVLLGVAADRWSIHQKRRRWNRHDRRRERYHRLAQR